MGRVLASEVPGTQGCPQWSLPSLSLVPEAFSLCVLTSFFPGSDFLPTGVSGVAKDNNGTTSFSELFPLNESMLNYREGL